MSQTARILSVLADGKPHSVTEIHERAGTSRLNSRVADLRKRGYAIVCTHIPGERGPSSYLYTLAEPTPLSGSALSPAGGGDVPSQVPVAGNDGTREPQSVTPAGPPSQLTLEEKFAAFYIDTYAKPGRAA